MKEGKFEPHCKITIFLLYFFKNLIACFTSLMSDIPVDTNSILFVLERNLSNFILVNSEEILLCDI